MPESRNTVAGKPLATGGVLVAPTGTVGPTDNSTALNAAFKALGYVGEDGLTESTDRSTDKVKAWGGDIVKVLQTDYSVTYQFTLIEHMNNDVLKALYGSANVAFTAQTVSTGNKNNVKLVSDTLPVQAWVFEVKDGLNRIRIYVPKGQITETGEVVYNDGQIVGHQVTLEAFYDTTLGANAIKYMDDGRQSVS
jgi:hypothetical protein